MGNCLICSHKKNNKIASLDDHDDTLDRLFETARKAADHDAANKGKEEHKKVTRVRVLVTKQELREILNCEDSNSKNASSSSLALEELVMRKVKLREFHEMFSSEDDEDQPAVANCGWKPALESIPEDS